MRILLLIVLAVTGVTLTRSAPVPPEATTTAALARMYDRQDSGQAGPGPIRHRSRPTESLGVLSRRFTGNPAKQTSPCHPEKPTRAPPEFPAV